MLNSDNEAKKDLLNRKPLAQQIVKGIMASFQDTNESLVIGINGKWGIGKSTLLSFIKEELILSNQKIKGDHKVIQFNSWSNTGESDLERNFLEIILKSLSEVSWKDSVKGVDKKFKEYLKYLDYLKFVKYVHPVAENILNALSDYSKKVNIHSLEEIKKQANELLELNNIKLYILIDDIDRLTPTEITALFKTLKVNLNLLNTFFIVAYDKDVVINALKNQYGENGERYLEKIIQVDFTVPQIMESQIKEVFFDKIHFQLKSLSITYNESDLDTLWDYHGLKEYFRTLRDLNRYFNNLIFSLPNVHEEVNIVDFLIIESIRTFDFSSYEKLYREINLIKRKGIWASVSFTSETLNEYQNETTKALLNYLILRQYPSYGKDSPNERRLRDPEFFERYFSLSINESDVTEESVKQFFLPKSNKNLILTNIYDSGKIKSFLKRLSDKKLSDFYQIEDENIFGDFLRFWNSLQVVPNERLDELIWNSYFNLAHNFFDKRKGAKLSFENLILSNNVANISFVFNHYLNLRYLDRKGDNQFYGEISAQSPVYEEDLIKRFNEYLAEQYEFYLFRINSDRGDWITGLFIYSFAKFQPSLYLKMLNRNLKNEFYSFIVNKFFVLGDIRRLNFEHKDIFFPDGKWDSLIQRIKNIKKETLKEEDYNGIKFFLEQIDLLNDF